MAPLQGGVYPDTEMNSPKWSASVNGGPTGAGFKSFIQHTTGGATGMAASTALNRYALEGVGQSGGGSRRRRHRKMGTRRRRGGALGGLQPGNPLPMAGPPSGGMKAPAPAPAPAHAVGTATRAKVGGMFATFGALLKEALVPLGLLAAQQTYGRKYRSSGSHTRKHRR